MGVYSDVGVKSLCMTQWPAVVACSGLVTILDRWWVCMDVQNV